MTKHRPVHDRIAETQAQLAQLIAKANKEQINTNPEVVALDTEIKNIQTSMLKYNRWASEGEEKIANFEARVIEWKGRLSTAKAKRKEASTQIEALREKRKALAETLASEIGTEA